MKRLLTLLLICCLALSFSASALEESEEFYVNDRAGLLSAEVRQYICEENYRLYYTCGAEVVVVTVDFIEGYDVEDFAYSVFSDWKLGDPEKNNGVLMVISPGSECVWIMPGDGIRGDALTPDEAQSLCERYLQPAMQTGDYDKAVSECFRAVVSRIDAKYGTETHENHQPSRGRGPSLGRIIMIVIIIFLILSLIRALTSPVIYINGRPYRRPGRPGLPVMPNLWSHIPRPPHGGSSFGGSFHSGSGGSHFTGGGRLGGGGRTHGGGGGRR